VRGSVEAQFADSASVDMDFEILVLCEEETSKKIVL
jgi:hypothetical protein